MRLTTLTNITAKETMLDLTQECVAQPDLVRQVKQSKTLFSHKALVDFNTGGWLR